MLVSWSSSPQQISLQKETPSGACLSPETGNTLPLGTNLPLYGHVVFSSIFCYLNPLCFQVWDVAKKRTRNVFRHRRGVSGVDFSPDGHFLVSCSHDGKVCIWSMRDGSSTVFLDTQSRYYSLRLSPDGRYIAATDYEGMLRIWNFRTGQRVRWKAHINEKGKDIPPATIAFLPDGNGLVTGSWDKTLKYWDVSSLEATQEGTLEQKEILTFHGHTVRCKVLSPFILNLSFALCLQDVIRGVTVSADGQLVIS